MIVFAVFVARQSLCHPFSNVTLCGDVLIRLATIFTRKDCSHSINTLSLFSQSSCLFLTERNMPKSTHRCNRRGHCGGPPTAFFLMTPPRKVSFEDSHHDSSSASGSSDCGTPVLTVLTEEPPPQLSRKPTLKRPKSSLSLVDLAKGMQSGEGESCSSLSSSRVRQDSHLPTPVSPLVVQPEEANDISTLQLPSSPWGQFVDMVIPWEETGAALDHHCDAPCSYCSTCRRRRANPYGDYKKMRRRPLCFKQDSFAGKESFPSFRLSPRKEPTDQLIGALDRLQFN